MVKGGDDKHGDLFLFVINIQIICHDDKNDGMNDANRDEVVTSRDASIQDELLR